MSDDLNVVSTKRAGDIIGIKYAGVRPLLDYFHIEPMKEGQNNFYSKDVIVAISDCMIRAQAIFDYGRKAILRSGKTERSDGQEVAVCICPHCEHDRAKIITKRNPNNTIYSFMRCMDCGSSSGCSKARNEDQKLLCEQEAIGKWNARSKRAMEKVRKDDRYDV